jgi:hypothetical protein
VTALKFFTVTVQPTNAPRQLALGILGLVTQACDSQVSLAVAHGVAGGLSMAASFWPWVSLRT